MNGKELLDMEQVAEMLTIHKKTLYRFIRSGTDETFPQPISFGPKTKRWVKADVEKWIAEKSGTATV